MRKLVVFVSSPGGTQAEREAVARMLFDRLNPTLAVQGVELVDWRWEVHSASRMGQAAQDNINRQLPKYDLYVGIMSNRFGTPTGEHGSGTEAEFREALQRAKEPGGPWVLFFFNDDPPAPKSEDELEQFARVLKFKKELKPAEHGCYQNYRGVDDSDDSFCRKLEHQLRLTVSQLVSAAPLPAPTPTELAVPPEYRAWLLQECAGVDLGGLQLKQGLSVRLSQVYVPLTTAAVSLSKRDQIDAPVPSGPEGSLGTDREPKYALILDLLGEESLYVSGDAGTGKSTFCRWLALMTAGRTVPPQELEPEDEFREQLPADFADRLVLLIRLREFADCVYRLRKDEGGRSLLLGDLERALRDWLDKGGAGGLDWPTVQAHLQAGRCLLLFDGVDEVSPSRGDEINPCYLRDMLVDGLAHAVKSWGARGNRLLVTSRPYGLDQSDVTRLGLRHAPIADLPGPLQHLLVRRWFRRLEDDAEKAEQTTNSLFGEIREREELDAMTANPMMLTAVCVLYGSENKRLPCDKFELYDRLVGNVLYGRYATGTTYQVHQDLRTIAYGMHTGEGLDDPADLRRAPSARVTHDHLDALLLTAWRDTRKDPRDVGQWRDALLARSGLLRNCGEKTAEFAHLSFQEFLAAVETVYRQEVTGWQQLAGVFERRAGVPQWRNTLSFIFGRLLADNAPPSRAVWLVEKLEDTIDRQPLDQTLGLQVALADGVHILFDKRADALPTGTHDRLVALCLAAIADEVSLQERHILALMLGKLGDPRIAIDLRNPAATSASGQAAFVEIPAGDYLVGDDKHPFRITEPFLLSRYLVTNSQYKPFVEACGYDNPAWWSAEGWQWRQETTANEKFAEPYHWRIAKWNGANQPVGGVSFFEAEAFANWAGGRLPTADESEAAARGPGGLVYPWGNDWDRENDKDRCNWGGAELGVTSPVGLFPRARSQASGLEDAAGNTWVWCSDAAAVEWMREKPQGRVVRGGTFEFGSRPLRAAGRFTFEPDERANLIGFRLARTFNHH